jgi:hypothetical protein
MRIILADRAKLVLICRSAALIANLHVFPVTGRLYASETNDIISSYWFSCGLLAGCTTATMSDSTLDVQDRVDLR